MKNINIELDEDLYYKTIELKARLHAETWAEFLRRVVELFGER